MVPSIEEIAEQFDNDHRNKHGYYLSSTEPIRFACEVGKVYAEMHRQEALKQASNKARAQRVPNPQGDFWIVNKDSILNAYSKKNIV